MKKIFLFVCAVFVCVSCSCDKGNVNLYPEDNSGKTVAEFGGVKISDKYVKTYVDSFNDYIFVSSRNYPYRHLFPVFCTNLRP